MPLTSGTKLGPYEIQSSLGAGGMGEVYRARDTRLDRTVAIKVLPSHLSTSPDLRARFEREAKSISGLQHPNICVLHDVGHQDGIDFLVMEYLEGETLATRLARKPLTPDEALRSAIEIADALDRAHRAGLVHRDLKPGNVMLTKGGAKLMDFGLAKLHTFAGSTKQAPSFTAAATMAEMASPITTAGTVVGTVQYMSPEQVQGKEADARSDIFAFGAILYEMLTGQRAFEGKSQLSVASAILEKDPNPISAIRPSVPPVLDHVVRTCLAKDSEERFQTAHDLKLELQWIAANRSSPPVSALPLSPSQIRERVGWAAAVVIALALGVIVGIFINRPTHPAQAIRTVVNPPANTTLSLTGDFAGPPVLSADGASIAFAATSGDGKTALWVRPMNVLEARALPGTEGAIFPFWSPDGRSIGFFADTKLKTIDLIGGSAVVICDAPFGRGGTWGLGGVILFSPNTQSP